MAARAEHDIAIPGEWVRAAWQAVLHRVSSVLRSQSSSQRRLHRLETLCLGHSKSVHLIECDGERYLVTENLGACVPVTAATTLRAQHGVEP